jgi:hypothetical protein
MTHTYSILVISQAAYDEIHTKLIEFGYEHAIGDDNTIDMHGIALAPDDDLDL